MTKSKHTPGPWLLTNDGYTLDPERPSANVVRIASIDGALVPRGCDVEAMQAEIEANKRLIAAAPELLAELREAMSTIDCLRDFVAEGSGHMVGARESVISADVQMARIHTLLQRVDATC